MSRKLKLVLFLVLFIVIAVVVRLNVTAVKEYPNRNGSGIVLEQNSEIVSKVLSKLDILYDSVFHDDMYEYLYFKFDDENTKTLSNDEMLYLVFEKLYKGDQFEKEIMRDDVEKLTIATSIVETEVERDFKLDDFKSYDVNYKTSSNCGIIGYLYTGEKYELKFKKCEQVKSLHRVKYEEALREGDIIKIKVKAFYGETSKNKYDEDDMVFSIKNFDKDKTLEKVSLKTLRDEPDKIFKDHYIDEYIFDFDFKEDDYNLISISRA